MSLRVQPCKMCWLWKEPLWYRRFEQYTLLVFRRMLDCWRCWGLSRAGGMHIWAGRIQVVFARWCVGVGCWLDVCAMECVSVVVSCCWKGAWAWVVVTRCRWWTSRCIVELCHATWFLWLPWLCVGARTGQGRRVWFPSSWCGGRVRHSVWWWLIYRGVLVCRVLGDMLRPVSPMYTLPHSQGIPQGLQLQDPVCTAHSKYIIHRASVALLRERITATRAQLAQLDLDTSTLRQSLQSTLNQQDFSKIQ